MEPIDYLKILQRHWKVVVALVVVVVAVVFVVSPSQPATTFEAHHTLLRDEASGDSGASSADNPSVVALWATRGEVPQRVAEALGHDGPVDELINAMTVEADIEVGTVEMTATASSGDEAVAIVNAFAEETLRSIRERDQARIADAHEVAADRTADVTTEIQQVAADLAAAGGSDAPNAALLESRIATLETELATISATEAAARTSTKWVSLQTATAASKAQASAVGVTRAQSLVLGALVSVLLAFGVAIMLDRSDSRLHTKEQVERQFGLPVLAEVPLLSLRTRHRAAVFGYQNDNRVAEAYRSLRTALLLFRDRLPLEVEAAELSGWGQGRSGSQASGTSSRTNGSRQVILVTSPEAGDGKSSTAANLAMAYAEAGQSVLLVQWDLWRPIPGRVFGVEDAPGVSEFLEAGNASLVRFVQSTSVPGLHIVTAGALGHQPGTQLDAELRLLEEARSVADVVIIDTAPLLGASVTRELVTMADVVVLASRAGRTTSPAAGRTAELLERLGAPTLGVVLVGVATGLFNDYYGAPSRADRVRTSVMTRVEPRAASGGPDTSRPEPRYAPPPPPERTDSTDVFRSPDRLPTRGNNNP
jgi:capsular exopolysaccharide synthesis family protein